MSDFKNGKKIDGKKQASELLAGLDSATRERILAEIEAQNPNLAAELKKGMFTLKQVFELAPADLAKVLKSVPQNLIALSLRGLSADLLALFFKGVSERQGQEIREEMTVLGPRKISDVKTAQDKIIEKAIEMGAKGEIELNLKV